jgi:hypothetical protein
MNTVRRMETAITEKGRSTWNGDVVFALDDFNRVLASAHLPPLSIPGTYELDCARVRVTESEVIVESDAE